MTRIKNRKKVNSKSNKLNSKTRIQYNNQYKMNNHKVE